MYGILGGLLEVVNVAGGIVLWALIGKPAWRENTTARWARILTGSVPCGLGLSLILVTASLPLIPADTPPADVYVLEGVILICGPFAVALVAILLEILRRSIEADKGDSDVQQ